MATGGASPITITGLTDGTPYTFTVTATNAAGTGPSSAASNQVTPVVMIPETPTAVAASPGNGEATVVFAPSTGNGAHVGHYTVTASPGGESESGSTGPVTVTGLTNGISYTFTVTATDTAGTSGASGASNPVTPTDGTRTAPPPPTSTSPMPTTPAPPTTDGNPPPPPGQ
jgi:hypothetical protein